MAIVTSNLYMTDWLAEFKEVAEHAPFGIQIYDAKGYTLYTNPIHTRIFGGPPPPEKCILNDEFGREAGFLPLIQQAFAGTPSELPFFTYDVRELKELSKEGREYVQKIGKKATISVKMVPVFDKNKKVTHVISFFRDVTAELFMQQEKERALKERDDVRNLTQRVLDQTPLIIHIKDVEGRYIFVNKLLANEFKRGQEEILGKTIHDLFPQKYADQIRAHDLKVMDSGAYDEMEEDIPLPDGTIRSYRWVKFPIQDSAGKLVGVGSIFSDNTKQKKLEKELNTAKRMETVGLLAGGIAHNFNNNLGIITLLAQTVLASKNKIDPEIRRSVESILKEAQMAAILTRQLLAFARRQRFLPRSLSVSAVVNDLKIILINAMGEDIHFSFSLAEDLWKISADPLQIEQIVTNLCFNSRDAMPKGGEIKITTANSAHGEFVELTVSDTGVGIDPSVIDRVFEPFFTTKEEGFGTGLGLSTVYAIVQDLGGHISVKSAPGKGATFTIQIPREKAAAAALSNADEPANESLDGTETILLVDDQDRMRMVTAEILKEHGYKIIEAKNSGIAMEIWKARAKEVDLVITDIVMPEINGLEMSRKMRDSSVKPFKVVFISAYSEKKLIDYGFCPAKTPFIEKPFSATELLKRVRKILDESENPK